MDIMTVAAIALSLLLIGGLVHILRKTGPDVNEDGKIDLEDAKAAVSKLKTEVTTAATAVKAEVTTAVTTAATAVKTEAPKKVAKVAEKVKTVADVNKDGKVDVKDVAAAATKAKGRYKRKK